MTARLYRLFLPLVLLAAGCPTTSTPPPQIVSFKATPSTIHAGQKSTLSWSVTGATTVTIDPGVTVPAGATTVDVTPTATTTYTLTAAGSGAPATQTLVLTVLPAVPKPVITSFTANPSTVSAGGSVTLSWTVTGTVDSASIDNSVGDVTSKTVSGAGQITVASVSPPVTYTLTMTNVGGSVTATASVALSVGKHLQYTNPTSTTAKLLLVQRDAGTTPSHLILDLKVGPAAVTAFGVALNIPFDSASAGMITFPSCPPNATNVLAGTINFGSSPATAAACLSGTTAVNPNLFTVGVAKAKASAADGDDTWAAGAVLFSVALDMASTATGGTNVFQSSALNASPCAAPSPCLKFRAAALHKDGTEAVSKPDIAVGDLIISN